jgi:hypothetical protein
MFTDECRSGRHDDCASMSPRVCRCMHHQSEAPLSLNLLNALRAIREDANRGVRLPVAH